MWKDIDEVKKMTIVKSVSCVTAAVLATGMIGVADINTMPGGLPIKAAEEVTDADVILQEAEASPEKQADLLQNIISTQVGSTGADVDKEESVYVVADASGAPSEVIVSDWLKNETGAKTITDTSDLKDIVNVKGDETYTTKGDEIVWDAEGSDIYYQGTTDKQLPVDMKITYYLDGKEISAEDLVGKSGNVKIRFDYSNNATYEAEIKGEETEVYVPFTTMTAMMLPTDRFTNVTVTNGKVMSEGSNNIVMGLAFPGLTDSLDLDREQLKEKDIEIPEYFEVEADVNNFKLDMTLTVALSDALSDIHLTDSIDLSNVEDSVDSLKDASTQLSDGSKALADGVKTLSEKTGEFADGADKLYSGISDYTDGAAALAAGIDTVKSGTSDLSAGATKLKDGANTLSAGATELNNKVQAISLPEMSGSAESKAVVSGAVSAAVGNSEDIGNSVRTATGDIVTYIAGLTPSVSGDASASVKAGTEEAIAELLTEKGVENASDIASEIMGKIEFDVSTDGISARINPAEIDTARISGDIQAPISTVATVAGGAASAKTMELVGGQMSSFAPIIAQLKEGTAALANGASEVASGASALSEGADKLNSGVGELQSGAQTLVGNNDSLKDGAGQLKDGTGKLTDGVNTLLTGANDLSDGLVRFDKEGVEKLTDAFEDEGEKVVDRLGATMDAAKSYHSFTGLADGKEGNVKFIIRTEAVK